MDHLQGVQTIVLRIDTNLNTRLVAAPLRTQTIGDIRAAVKLYHSGLYPDLGEVDVTAVEVELLGGRCRLPDPVVIGQLFREELKAGLFAELISRSNTPSEPLRLTGTLELNHVVEQPKPDQQSAPVLLGTDRQVEGNDASERRLKQEITLRNSPAGTSDHRELSKPTSDHADCGVLHRRGQNSDVDESERTKKRSVDERDSGDDVMGSQVPDRYVVEGADTVTKKSRICGDQSNGGKVHEGPGRVNSKRTGKDSVAMSLLAGNPRKKRRSTGGSPSSLNSGFPVTEKLREEHTTLMSNPTDEDVAVRGSVALEHLNDFPQRDASESSRQWGHPATHQVQEQRTGKDSVAMSHLGEELRLNSLRTDASGSSMHLGLPFIEKLHQERAMFISNPMEEDAAIKRVALELLHKSYRRGNCGSSSQSGHTVTHQELHSVDELDRHAAPISLADGIRSKNFVPDPLVGASCSNIGNQDALLDVTALKPLRKCFRETKIWTTESLDVRSSAVQKDCSPAVPLQDGVPSDGKLRPLSRLPTNEIGEKMDGREYIVTISSESELELGEELRQDMSLDSQQLRAAVQLARMAEEKGVDSDFAEDSPSKKRLRKVKGSAVMDVREFQVDVTAMDESGRCILQDANQKNGGSPVGDSSAMVVHKAGNQKLQTECLASPNQMMLESNEEVVIHAENVCSDILLGKKKPGKRERKKVQASRNEISDAPQENLRENHDTVEKDESSLENSVPPHRSVDGIASEEHSGRTVDFEYRDLRKTHRTHLAAPYKTSEEKQSGLRQVEVRESPRLQDNQGAVKENIVLARRESNEAVSSCPENISPHLSEPENDKAPHLEDGKVHTEHNQGNLLVLRTSPIQVRKTRGKGGPEAKLFRNESKLSVEVNTGEIPNHLKSLTDEPGNLESGLASGEVSRREVNHVEIGEDGPRMTETLGDLCGTQGSKYVPVQDQPVNQKARIQTRKPIAKSADAKEKPQRRKRAPIVKTTDPKKHQKKTKVSEMQSHEEAEHEAKHVEQQDERTSSVENIGEQVAKPGDVKAGNAKKKPWKRKVVETEGKQGNSSTPISRNSATGRFCTILLNPKEGAACPHGCGQMYANKNSAYWRHKKSCALRTT